MNDLCDENEDLRGRLGLDPRKPVDLTQFRSDKAKRLEGDKATNFMLQKEVGVALFVTSVCLLHLEYSIIIGRHTLT